MRTVILSCIIVVLSLLLGYYVFMPKTSDDTAIEQLRQQNASLSRDIARYNDSVVKYAQDVDILKEHIAQKDAMIIDLSHKRQALLEVKDVVYISKNIDQQSEELQRLFDTEREKRGYLYNKTN